MFIFWFQIISDCLLVFLLVSLSWLSLRICFILPLLPVTEVWWQTRLCLFEKTSAWPFHSWRFEPRSSIYVLFWDVPCSVLLDKNIIGTKWIFICLSLGCCLHLTPGFQFDYVFDWTILKYQQSQSATAPARAIVSAITCYLTVLADW